MKHILLFFLLLIGFQTGFSQSLNKQYDSLTNNSESFKQYKVIERQALNAFWQTTQDSIAQLKANLKTEQELTASQEDTINQLNQTINTKDEEIAELETQTSTIEVFGLDVSKSTYIFISFFSVGVLIIVLIVFLYRFKENNRIARAKVIEYDKLHNEFEEYKRKALEKQMKLRRELQTERNKLEEARKK